MPGLLPRGHRGRPLVNRLHSGGLFERTGAGSPSAAAVPVGASGAQVLPVDGDDQAAVDRLVDGLGTHVPGTTPSVMAPQPPADLRRRPAPCEPAGHGLSQPGIDAEPVRLGSSAPLVGAVVRIPGLVAAIGLAVASDLSVDALKGLPDPCRDQLDLLTSGQPITGTTSRSRSRNPASISATRLLYGPAITEQQLYEQVLPSLRDVPLSKIERTTRVSNSACSCIRSGPMTPHPRHWEALARLAAADLLS
jgi:hypothetical protein